jgi:hypothetical protein
VARCACLAYADPEAPARPPFTPAEERALWSLTHVAGPGRLSVAGVRYVLARCQLEGGDPARVYEYFVATHEGVRTGRVPVPPMEVMQPREEDLRRVRAFLAGRSDPRPPGP